MAVSSADQLGEIHYRIATALLLDDDPDGAIKHFRKSIILRPNNIDAHLKLVEVLIEQSRFAEAVATLRQGVEVVPNDLRLRNELAWLLATSPDTRVRNGLEAERIAHDLLQAPGTHRFEILDTLAAAQAEAGYFDEAIRTAHEAIVAATPDQTNQIHAVTMRLRLYENRQPFHLTSP